METENDLCQFGRMKWLSGPTDLDVLFEKATAELSTKPWFTINGHCQYLQDTPPVDLDNWNKVLTFPRPRPERSYTGRFTQDEAKWMSDERAWGIKVAFWLRNKRLNVEDKRQRAKTIILDSVKTINSTYRIHLKPEVVLRAWRKSTRNFSLTEFELLAVSYESLSPFLAQQANQYENRRTDATRDEQVPKTVSVTSDEVAGRFRVSRPLNKKLCRLPACYLDLQKQS